MAILHMVIVRWKPEVTEAQIATATAAILEMRAQMTMLKSYEFGPNLHLRTNGADFGFAALVESPEDLVAYLDHPLHQHVYETYVAPMVAERRAVQLATDSAPAK